MARGPASEHVQVNFRLPVRLRDRIKASADRHGVSMTNEITETLLRSYPEPRTAKDVVNEISELLGFYDEKLRSEAIALLEQYVSDGSLDRRSQVQAWALKQSLRDDD